MFPKVTWESPRLPEKSCDHDVFDTNKIIWFSHAKFAPTICRVSGRRPERLGVFLQNSYISKRGLARSLDLLPIVQLRLLLATSAFGTTRMR